MNTRQWELYNFLKENAGVYMKQEEIAEHLPVYAAQNEAPYHHQKGRRLMTADIKAINAEPHIQKFIVSDGNGVALATEDMAEKFISRLYREAFEKLKQARRTERKCALDGQYKVYGRPEIQSFADALLEEK